MQITNVKRIISFDEEKIAILTSEGMRTVRGERLHITQLNLMEGTVTIEGKINIIT